MENYTSQQPHIFPDGPRENLPNATAVLVLGIISIIGCFCYGIVGFVCGIIALVLSRKDMMRHRLSPGLYTASSLANLKAGRVCAIIGTILSSLYFLLVIFIIAIIGIAGLSHPEEFLRNLQH